MRAVLLCILLSIGVAQSAEVPKKKAAVNAQGAQANQRGTDESPFVIKILPAQEAEAQPNNGKGEEQESPEASTARATWALVYWTAGLTIFTAALLGANFFLLKNARSSSRAARDSADALINSARPVLLPKVVLTGQMKLPVEEPIHFRPEISFVFENFGSGVAIIKEITAELFVFRELPEVREFTDEVRISPHLIIVPGGYRVKDSDIFSRMNSTPARLKDFITSMEEIKLLGSPTIDNKRIYLVGKVNYVDPLGYDYETGFCHKVFENKQHGARGGEHLNYYRYKKHGEKWPEERATNA